MKIDVENKIKVEEKTLEEYLEEIKHRGSLEDFADGGKYDPKTLPKVKTLSFKSKPILSDTIMLASISLISRTSDI